MAGETDRLLGLAKEVAGTPAAREVDVLLATGEMVSIALVAMALLEAGCPARSFTGVQGGIVTDGAHTHARIRSITTTRLQRDLCDGVIPVVAGFQGISENDELTTLGRGGSDLTAVALASALDADSCEIYTDVDGVYTADPNLVPAGAPVWIAFPTTRCWRWRAWAPRFYRPAPSSSPRLTTCLCGSSRHFAKEAGHWSPDLMRIWNAWLLPWRHVRQQPSQNYP